MAAEEHERRTPWFRVAAVAAFLLSAALPVYSCSYTSTVGTPRRAVVLDAAGSAATAAATSPAAPVASSAAAFPPARSLDVVRHAVVRTPWTEITRSLDEGWERAGVIGAVWQARTWYPYLLGPLWLLALLLAPRLRTRGRALLGATLLSISLGIVVLEAFYIARDYGGMFQGFAGRVEHAVAWVAVVAILFVRPGGMRMTDVAGIVSSQALLGFFHAMTFPAHDVVHGAASDLFGTLTRVFLRYRPAFWLAVGAMLLAAIPAYLPRRSRLSDVARA